MSDTSGEYRLAKGEHVFTSRDLPWPHAGLDILAAVLRDNPGKGLLWAVEEVKRRLAELDGEDEPK